MKKTISILIVAVLILPFLFTTTSCTPNNNPTPIRDTTSETRYVVHAILWNVMTL